MRKLIVVLAWILAVTAWTSPVGAAPDILDKRVSLNLKGVRAAELFPLFASLVDARLDLDYETEAAVDCGLDFKSLPRGVLVGTVELVGCDEGDWYMQHPERCDELRKPARRPNPVWFFPFEEDAI